jgi:hypothetical protein
MKDLKGIDYEWREGFRGPVPHTLEELRRLYKQNPKRSDVFSDLAFMDDLARRIIQLES